ncbi:MAG: DUF1987 domain-containing protein [Deltaproteobacteria bacterium]|nr:DUF1987 domain-containing protein [Deltaproteobacteria bacterium]
MEDLTIPATLSSPRVEFDVTAGTLRLTGESYPEHSLDFYRPILVAAAAFLRETERPFAVELRLSYLNTSSIRSLMDLLDDMEAAHRRNRPVTLTWFYDEENERALELAEEFREDLTLPFFLVPLRSEG